MDLPLHKLKLPPQVDPLSMDVLPYTAHVRQRNRLSRERSEAFLDALGASQLVRESIGISSDPHIALIVNGSDGREENCTSPLEPIVFIEEALPVQVVQNIRQQLNALLSGISGYMHITRADSGESSPEESCPFVVQDVYDPIVEVKMLAEGQVAHYRDQNNIPRDLWPSRIFDAAPISSGSEVILARAQDLLCGEIAGAVGKKMLERERGRIRDYAAVCRADEHQGTQLRRSRTITHFDLKEGVAHYNRTDTGLDARSFKYGPLRLVQHTLISELMRAMRERSDDALRLVQTAPSHTADKLAFLKQENILRRPQAEVERMTLLYLYFLRLYHLSEFHYVISGQRQTTVEIPDSQEVAENLQELLTLVDLLRGK